jgi:diacylglycerol kinase family enzyme
MLFARAGLREFFTSDRRHPHLSIRIEPGEVLDDIYYAVVTNTDPWTYIGSRALHPTPDASFDTGLDLFARTRMGTPGVVFTIAQIARTHPKPQRWGSVVRHDLTAFTVSADEPMPLQVDGELIGTGHEVHFTSAREALNVIVSP